MHKSWVDALLLMTSVLGALAGGAIFQWLFGLPALGHWRGSRGDPADGGADIGRPPDRRRGHRRLPTSLLLASARLSQRLGRLRETLAIPLRYLTNSFNDPCSSIETTYCQDQWRHLEDPKDFVMSVLKFQTFYDHND
jgi:hypothetical protein